MNTKDMLKQQLFPTIMVPQFEELDPCRMNMSRLLIAANGLFIEAVKPWGRIVAPLWVNNRERGLPYGKVIPYYDDFLHILSAVSPVMSTAIVPAAAEYAERDLEWGGWIVHEDGELRYQPVDFEATSGSARITYPELQGTSLAVDIHSHGRIVPFFSSTDNKDDSGGVRISIVLGNYSNQEGRASFDYRVRFCVEGYFFDVTKEANTWSVENSQK